MVCADRAEPRLLGNFWRASVGMAGVGVEGWALSRISVENPIAHIGPHLPAGSVASPEFRLRSWLRLPIPAFLFSLLSGGCRGPRRAPRGFNGTLAHCPLPALGWPGLGSGPACARRHDTPAKGLRIARILSLMTLFLAPPNSVPVGCQSRRQPHCGAPLW